MESNVYLIRWYGPFENRKLMKEWEDKRHETFNLYVFQANKKGRKDRYYCGMAFRQSVGERMRNANHHIHDFENDKSTSLQIWIGTIVNKKAKKVDVSVCENLITSELASIGVGERFLENGTNKKPPLSNVYILNEWWKTNGDELLIKRKNSVPSAIHEAMAYFSETKTLYGAKKLKEIGVL